jgi:hypothetical protein
MSQQVDACVAANQTSIFGELLDVLHLPNVAADRASIRRNADGGAPRDGRQRLVCGERHTPGARTILIDASDRPSVAYGARGILPRELTVYGPKISVHSGNYGNRVHQDCSP